jgi:probable phosphoglycerate mutase
MRHGQSRANVLSIIVSRLENEIREEYSLSALGEHQVSASMAAAKKDGTFGSDTLIYSSPLSRCVKTAEIVQEILGAPEVMVDVALRERDFGTLEMGPEKYPDVWGLDARDENHKTFGVESVREVQERMACMILSLERQYQGKKILIVSHGDPLQILQTYFLKISPAVHRSIRHIETGEIFRFA